MPTLSMQSALRSALDGLQAVTPKGSHVGADGLAVCDRCGDYRQCAVTDPEGVRRVLPCACACDGELARADAERARERVSEARRRMAFPSDAMASKTFAADDGRFGVEQMGKAKAYAERLTRGGCDYGLLFFGRPDGGKTFMSCCIANAALDAGLSVVVRSMPQLLSDMDADLDRLTNCDLLVLDDLGAERSTSYGQERVYAIVDGRYNAKRPMVVSTNLSRQELASPPDTMSARIWGRVLESCLPVEVETGRRRATRERYEKMMQDLNLM